MARRASAAPPSRVSSSSNGKRTRAANAQAARPRSSTAVSKKPTTRGESADKAAANVTSMPTAMLSIGELAALTHLSTRTIRYYEELGILPSPPRSAGGTRRYPREFAFYLEGARALKQLGFTLDEIAEIGRWALKGRAAPTRTQGMLRAKVTELEHRIKVLNRMHDLVLEAAHGGRPIDPAGPALLAWLGSDDVRSSIEAS
jgi:DNA-binding transcriptional MerR regulator